MSVNDVYDKMIERSGNLEYGQDIFTSSGAYDFGKEIYGDNFTEEIGE
jgi:hypothetical protein